MVLFLKDNRLATKEGGKVLAEALAGNLTLKELDVSSNNWSKDDGRDTGDGPGFAQELGIGLKDNGALSKLDASNNDMFGRKDKSAIQAWADALKSNSSLLELNLAKTNMRGDDAKIFADGIRDNGALSVLNLASNNLGELVLPDGWSIWYEGESYEKYAHLDGREQTDHPGRPDGIIAVANAIKDMGALSSVNVLSNVIPVEQAQELVKIMRSKDTLTTLCGLTGVETKLDFSSQGMGAGDAVLIANDISDMGNILLLNMSSNELKRDGTLSICDSFLCRYFVLW
jgi:hypothetical protein